MPSTAGLDAQHGRARCPADLDAQVGLRSRLRLVGGAAHHGLERLVLGEGAQRLDGRGRERRGQDGPVRTWLGLGLGLGLGTGLGLGLGLGLG